MKLDMTTRQNGFSLVEVVMALGIASFCLVGLLALLPVGISSNKDAIQRTIAAGFASEVVSDLKNAPLSDSQQSVESLRFKFTIPNVGGMNSMTESPQTIFFSESGSASTIGADLTVDSRYRVSVGFAPPSTGQKAATMVRVLVSWPAQADANVGMWPQRYSGSYEVITALDRN